MLTRLVRRRNDFASQDRPPVSSYMLSARNPASGESLPSVYGPESGELVPSVYGPESGELVPSVYGPESGDLTGHRSGVYPRWSIYLALDQAPRAGTC